MARFGTVKGMFRKLQGLIILMSFNLTMLAQSCYFSLTGAVSDGQSHALLRGATVRIKEIDKKMMADKNGSYHFPHLCAQSFTVEVSFVGYETILTSVEVSGDTKLNVTLKMLNTTLSEVRITGKRSNVPLMPISVLQNKALELTRGQSLGEALKNIPGMSSMQTGPSISKPVIHGMHSNRVLIYNAGVRQEGQQWGSEHAPEVDPFIATRISVIKGAASVIYGSDAIGGVILVEPAPLSYKAGSGGRIEAIFMSNNGLGALAATGEGAGKNGLVSYRMQLTTRQAGNTKTPDYYLKNTGFREYNGAFILGFQKNAFSSELYASTFNSRLGIFEGSHIGNTTDLMAAITRKQPLIKARFSYALDRPYQLINHNIIKLKSSYYFSQVGKLQMQYSYQRNNREEYDLVRRSYEENYQLKFNLATQAADLFLDHNQFFDVKGKIGVNVQHQQNAYDGRYLIPFFNSRSLGSYIIERWTKSKWEIEAGLRYDYKYMQARLRQMPTDQNSPEIRPEFNFSQFTGTVGITYQLDSNWHFNTGLTKGWRPPSINELFSQGVHHGSARFELGNRDLKEESNLNFYAGLTKKGSRLNGEINLYHNTVENYIYLKPGQEPVLTVRGAFLSYDYVQVNAAIYGADASVNYAISNKLHAIAKYSAVRAYNRQNQQHLELIPPDRVSGTLSLDLPDFKKLTKNAISLSAVRTAGQTRVKDWQDFAPVPSGYTLYNIDISTQCRIFSRQASISVSAYNLFNKSYRDYLNAFRYFAADAGRNIALRLSIPFGRHSDIY